MIKNLVPSLPEMGKIKIGMKGKKVVSKQGNEFRQPEKLNHFIITTTERDDNDNLIHDDKLMDLIKANPSTSLSSDKNILSFPIRLLYNDIDLNFHTKYACYAGGKCLCSGDGEKATTRDGREVSCPCEKIEYGYNGKNKCKANGRLLCILDDTTAIGACHAFRTTSINSVKAILGGLLFIQQATSGLLAFLPLQLVIQPKTTITPSGAKTIIHFVSIIYRGKIEDLRRQVIGMAKEKTQYLLEMDNIENAAREKMATEIESEEEQKTIQEEFYPESKIEPEPELEPELKIRPPKPEPKNSEKPEPEPEIKPKPEPKPEPEPEKPEPITIEQKKEIVRLKKVNKITVLAEWQKLLVPFGVATANDLTFEQARTFIDNLIRKKEIDEDDIPF